MRKALVVIVAAFLTCSQPRMFSQGGPAPTAATDVTNADVLTVLKMAQTDQQLKVVDLGTYNVGVGVLHRGKTGPTASTAEGVNGLSHTHVSEIYYIISGSGTLVTGGTMNAPRPNPPRARPSRCSSVRPWADDSRTGRAAASAPATSSSSRPAFLTASARSTNVRVDSWPYRLTPTMCCRRDTFTRQSKGRNRSFP